MYAKTYLGALMVLILTIFVNRIFAQEKGASPLSNQGFLHENKNTYAVVVGISDYQDPAIPDLRFADKDAEVFANYLRSNAGGNVDEDHLKVFVNNEATIAQFAMALDWLMEVVKENDQVILYFSGHGDVEKKTISQPGYLLCWDAPARVYMAGGAFALPMLQEVVSTLSIRNKAKVIVIADACRSGTLAGNAVGGSQATASNLARQFANEVKILSCQPNEYSIEGEQWGGGRGAFSFHLMDALYGLADKNQDQWITLYEIGRYLEDHVTAEVAPVSQVPMIVGNRNERLTTVDTALLAAIKSSKTTQPMMLSAIESKGLEEEILSQLDSHIREVYSHFKNALQNKIFFEPENASANSYYELLLAESKLEKLHSTMKRNFAAALQDDAQQVMNKLLKTDLNELKLSKKTAYHTYQHYPLYLKKAAELLGAGHYLYPVLMSKMHFFNGYLISISKMDPDSLIGRKALFELGKSLEWQADQPQVYLLMSNVFAFNFLQPDSAEYYARKAIEMYPSWLYPYNSIAYIFIENFKQFERAKPYLDKAYQLDSNSALVLNELGYYYFRQKKYMEAENYCKKAIQMDTNWLNAYNCLGLIYLAAKRFTEAEIYCKKAIQLDSTFFEFYNNLGIIYVQTGSFAEAELQFKKAIQLDSTDASAYSNLGYLYNLTRRDIEAEVWLNKAIQLDSTIAEMYLNLGIVYFGTNRPDQGELQLKKAIQLDSMLLNAYNPLAVYYWETDRFTESEQLLQKAIQLDSSRTENYINLGIFYGTSNRFAEAAQQFKTVVSLDPTNYDAFYNLACIQSRQNYMDQAFETLEKALQAGYKNLDWLLADPDLNLLREQKERWSLLLKKYFPDKIVE